MSDLQRLVKHVVGPSVRRSGRFCAAFLTLGLVMSVGCSSVRVTTDFDPDADLTPLVELSEELAEVQARIARTDALIEQIVHRLYGLTEEEVAVVEGQNH